MARPTIVVCLFDQKSGTGHNPDNAKVAEMKRVPHTASDIIRYCARLKILPGPYRPPVDVPFYITRGGEVGAVAFRNFECNNHLAGMARELEHDAWMASPSVKRPWIHGCISIDVSPRDYDGQPEDLLKMGHSLMRKFGVEENRYMLAVHLDSSKIHVHFFYARVDSEGRLRERDRKMSKFMADEATALLAHEFGFSLASRHLSRVTPEGILDLASDSIVRTMDFEEVPNGMRRRNAARKKTKRNDLLTLALVARHEAADLLELRQMLAPHGITYERNGSGARFIDVEGEMHDASIVDTVRRFTPTNLFGGALLTDFPPTPAELADQAKEARAYAKLARAFDDDAKLPRASDDDANLAYAFDDDAKVALLPRTEASPIIISKPSRSADAGYGRFVADRLDDPRTPCEDERCWDAGVRAIFRERPGRPRESPKLPGWPQRMCVRGAIGAPDDRPAPIAFAGDQYRTIERAWQTEIWNGRELVASVRYSRMAILSNNEDDLRAALKAAHKAWGSVEVHGRPAFKKKMARLALELDIPLSNRELQRPLAQARVDLAKSQTPSPAKLPAHVPSAHDSGGGKRPVTHSKGTATSTNRGSLNPMTESQIAPPADAKCESRSVIPETAEIAGAEREASPIVTSDGTAKNTPEPIAILIDRADRERWEITLVRHEGDVRAHFVPPLGELAPEHKQRFQSDFQNLLRPLLKRQRSDHDLLFDAVRNGKLRLESASGNSNDTPREAVTSSDTEVMKLWQSYKNQAEFTARLLERLRQTRQEEQEWKMSTKAAQEAKRNLTRNLAQVLAAGPTEAMDLRIVSSAEPTAEKPEGQPEVPADVASDMKCKPVIDHVPSTNTARRERDTSSSEVTRVSGPLSQVSQAARDDILRPRVLGNDNSAHSSAKSPMARIGTPPGSSTAIKTRPKVDLLKTPSSTPASEQKNRRAPVNEDVERTKLLNAMSKGLGK